MSRASLAALIAALGMGSCAAMAPAATAPTEVNAVAVGRASVARGETLVRRHCAGCHAVGRTDSSRLAGAPELRELHRRYEPEALSEALAEGILTGHPAMPEFRFPPQDVRAVIRYLDAIQTRQRS